MTTPDTSADSLITADYIHERMKQVNLESAARSTDQFPDGTLKTLEVLSQIREPSLFFLRHSQRQHLKDFGEDIPLTDVGIEHCKLFGEKLQMTGKVPGMFLTSPFERCEKTLKFIQSGWGVEAEIRREILLYNAFVEDIRTFDESFFKLGAYGLLNRLKVGEKVTGWLPMEDGLGKLEQLFDRILAEHDHNENSVSFCASHEDPLSALIGKYTKMNERGEHFHIDNWPCYLEGILLTKSFVVWRGEKYMK